MKKVVSHLGTFLAVLFVLYLIDYYTGVRLFDWMNNNVNPSVDRKAKQERRRLEAMN